MLNTSLSITTLLLFLASVLPMTNISFWWIRDLDFPRFQFAVALALNIIVIIVFGDTQSALMLGCLAVSIACLGVQLWWIYPYTFFHSCDVPQCSSDKAGPVITLLSSNVLTPNKNAEGLLELVAKHDPDIIVTLESDQWWEDALSSLEKNGYNHCVKRPLDNLYGMHVYSKLKLHNTEVKHLIEDDVPSVHTCVELDSGEQVQMHFLHPAPPSPSENQSSSERDAELIIVAKQLSDYEDPVIVTGDLNDVAWSKTTRIFRQLSGLKDPRIGRGMFNTFHADYWFMRWPLDHLFHSRHFTLDTIKRLHLGGSDHFALFTRLCLENSHVKKEKGEELEEDDKALVEDRVEEHQADENEVPQPGQ